jgi:hypothetical protein
MSKNEKGKAMAKARIFVHPIADHICDHKFFNDEKNESIYGNK